MLEYFKKCVDESCVVKKESFESNRENLQKAAELIVETLRRGKKLLVFGNGGSASDAQHFVAEFVVRLKLERRAYPAIALNTDTAILTSCGNDYGYDRVFSRQVEALACEGDTIIAISTSGNSPNVLLAIEEARRKKAHVMGLTGESGGKLADKCDILIGAKSKETMRIQETHIMFLHVLADIVERTLEGEKI
ncbi:MAG TPA: SIS domain-containing protein [bacterium]|nr:SIS domain-containing protein [bacterium]